MKPEAALQRSIIQGLRVGLPHGWIVAHVPNGGKRSKVEGAIFKALGVVPGMPDIMILGVLYYDGPKRDEARPVCAFLEVKAVGGALTAVQRACHDRLADLGFQVAIVKSWAETVTWCKAWGLPLRVGA